MFEEDDYRLVRFMNRSKEVNDNWAIKLIDEVPPAPTKDRIVACDGGDGPLGHPKVYINLVRFISLNICILPFDILSVNDTKCEFYLNVYILLFTRINQAIILVATVVCASTRKIIIR